MNRDYRLGSISDAIADLSDVEVIAPGIDVDIDGTGTQQDDGFSGGYKRKWRCDHLVPRTNAQSHHGNLKSIRSRGTTNSVGYAKILGQLEFKLANGAA